MTHRPTSSLPGWIQLFVAQQLVAILFGGRAIVRLWLALAATGATSISVRSVAAPYEVSQIVLFAVPALVSALGLFLITARAGITRRYWIAALTLLPTWRVLELLVQRLQRDAIVRAGWTPAPSAVLSRWAYVISCCMIVAWWLYWLRSRAVRETFVEPPAEVGGTSALIEWRKMQEA
jgi:hypothetical protein